MSTCQHIVKAAKKGGLDPLTMAAVGWVESGMLTTVVSRAGAIGPLQVMPKYWCPKGQAQGCDTISAGIEAFKVWRKHFPKLKDTLCHYNSGWKCNRYSRHYARSVLRERRKIKVNLNRLKL
jgi:soluble lytic murein transglycosylase-like protein